MKRTSAILALIVAAAIALTVMLVVLPPAEATEAGVTIDEGICWEADGTQGVTMVDGECVTPADYDAMFSFENLSNVPSAYNPDVSIAEEAGLVDDGELASLRPNGAGLVEVSESFADHVVRLHGPFMD